MTDTEPTIVAVPVGLLSRILDGDASPQEWAQASALIPKPKPRLVAVTHEQWMNEDSWDAQPDLLTLLDEAVDEVMNVTDWPRVRDGLKARIRAALGVTE